LEAGYRSQVKPSLSERLVGGPAGFRRLLLRLGPTFIKAGQFLALRPDLVPQVYCDELLKLLDQVPAFPWSEAKRILTEDFGQHPSAIFEYINPYPVAAGSLAQTHFARLHNGTEVAVKIQRPNIRQRVLKDLSRARTMARLLSISRVSLVIEPRDVVEELSGWMMRELDFRIEVQNMSRLYQLSARSAGQRIPRPHPELCSERVVTAEFLRGIPMTEVLVATRANSEQSRQRLAALGIDRDQLATNFFNSVLTQIFRFQFFHADLHPGNLLVLPGNVVGFVDFGLCEQIDETIREKQLRYLSAVYSGQTENVFNALLEILTPGDSTDIEAFRRDFYEDTSAWNVKGPASRHPVNTNGPTHSATGDYLISVMRSARRNHLQVPTRVLAMYRALLTSESVVTQLGDGLDLRAVGRRFFGRLQVDEAIQTLKPDNLQPLLLTLFTLLRDSPGQLQQILFNLAAGRLGVKVEVSEARREVRERQRRTRAIVVAIVAVSVAILLSSGRAAQDFGAPGRWGLWVALVILYLYILFQWMKLK
jgi:ubiquinone biosynthesis protein